jgi:uncharacterized repeat protein (TIGR03803 family)
MDFPRPECLFVIALRAAAKPKTIGILTSHEMWREDNIQKREDRASQPVQRIHTRSEFHSTYKIGDNVMKYTKFLGAASAALMIVIAVLMLAPNSGAQSKYKTLYKFKGCPDGRDPLAGLIFDQAGNLYGTTELGGSGDYNDSGTVFKLTPNQNGGWTQSVLYSFCSLGGCPDGLEPYAGLIFDQAGRLYGTAAYGGHGYGTVFKLTPNQNGARMDAATMLFRLVVPPGRLKAHGGSKIKGSMTCKALDGGCS